MDGSTTNDPNSSSIPKLEDICVNFILSCKIFNTMNKSLELYVKVNDRFPQNHKIKTFAKNNLRDFYPAMVSLYGEDQLADFVEEEDLAYFKSQFEDSLQVKKRFSYLKGEILEREKIQEVSTDGYYSYEALKAGMEWPKDVDPTKRESYLSPTDFEFVFHMTKEQFNLMDKFKRIQLKKEKKLF